MRRPVPHLLKSINAGRGLGLGILGGLKSLGNQSAACSGLGPRPPMNVYVQNPFTGAYLLAKVAGVGAYLKFKRNWS